jgi:hypothetical protein
LRRNIKDTDEPTPIRSPADLRINQETDEDVLRSANIIYEKKNIKVDSQSPYKQENFKNLEP